MLKSVSIALSATLVFTACGGGSDSPNIETVTGTFIDSVVEGVTYKCSSGTAGTTNSAGEYTCNVGDTVTFSIGVITLGTTDASLTPITPYTLQEHSDVAVNMAQLLQTMDSDNDPSNGITLDSELIKVLETTEIKLSDNDFDTALSNTISKTIVTESQAKEHLDESVKKIEVEQNFVSEAKLLSKVIEIDADGTTEIENISWSYNSDENLYISTQKEDNKIERAMYFKNIDPKKLMWKNNPTKEVEYDSEGEVRETTYFEYDNKNNLIKTTHAYPDMDEYISTYEYEYNDNGTIKKKMESENWYETYEYDNNGNLVKVIENDSGVASVEQYEYNSNNNLSKVKTYINNVLIYVDKLSYNSDGHLIFIKDYEIVNDLEEYSGEMQFTYFTFKFTN